MREVRGPDVRASSDKLDLITDTYTLNRWYWHYWDRLIAVTGGTSRDEDIGLEYACRVEAVLRRLRDLGHSDTAAERLLAEAVTRLARGN